MAITLQSVGTQPRLDVAPEAAALEVRDDKTPSLGKASTSVASKLDPATVVTLSDAAKAKNNETKPIRVYSDEELARMDPMQRVITLAAGYIESDKAHLAYLESDVEVINLLTGKAITPEVRERHKESTLRRIKHHEDVLQEHLTIAAGGNPTGDKAKAAAALDTLAAPQNVAAPEISNLADIKAPAPVKTFAPAASKSNAVISASLLIELLTKGNEAYRAAVKRGGVIPS